jgi:hypothetical protein
MAKFIMFVRNDNMYNNRIKLYEGLNVIENSEPITTSSEDTFFFNDTNRFSTFCKDRADCNVYDVEIPDGECFIAHLTFYSCRRIILSNPRKLWIDGILNPEFHDVYNESARLRDRILNINIRYYIAYKDSNHKLINWEE